MTIDAERAAVREHLLAAKESAHAGDLDAAAEATRQADAVVERRAADGDLIDLLAPLLDPDERRHVRYAAAAYLCAHGEHQIARPVLNEIANAGKGPEAPKARALLGV